MVALGRRKWQPNPVFLPGESHGQKSLVGYSPWGHKESDTTERLSTHTHVNSGHGNVWTVQTRGWIFTFHLVNFNTNCHMWPLVTIQE